MASLNLLRPDTQTDSYRPERDYFSVENLDAHDADVPLRIDFSGEDQDRGPGTHLLADVGCLATVQAGQANTIDGTASFGAACSKIDTFLNELERSLLARVLDVVAVQE